MTVGTNSSPGAVKAAGTPSLAAVPPQAAGRAAAAAPAAGREPGEPAAPSGAGTDPAAAAACTEFAALGIDPDDLPDGLVIADDTGRVICFNAAAARITALAPAEALGTRIDRALPLEDLNGWGR